MTTKECRINRIKSLLDFDSVKRIVKNRYDYDIIESCLEDFFKYINEYDDIDELELLGILENESFIKMSVLNMRKIKKAPHYPICEEILNPMLLQLFKSKNNIKSKEYVGELGECYEVIYYNENRNKDDIKNLDIKIACVRSFEKKLTKEDGVIEEIKEEIYDCARFIIDIDNKLIYMFYNDWPNGYNSNVKGYTEKKRVLYTIFHNASQGNVLSYVLSDSLTDYFKDYYLL